MEMTLREVYVNVLLDIYNNAVESIKIVDVDEFKKSVIASYSFRYNTMTLFKRKVLQGAVSLEDMIKENERRGYEYL